MWELGWEGPDVSSGLLVTAWPHGPHGTEAGGTGAGSGRAGRPPTVADRVRSSGGKRRQQDHWLSESTATTTRLGDVGELGLPLLPSGPVFKNCGRTHTTSRLPL